MRSSILLAAAVVLAHVQTAASQVDTPNYCRIYRTMTLGDGVACYYCLPCPTCTGPPLGYMGTWTESTGGCSACGAHCFSVKVASTAEKSVLQGGEKPTAEAASPGVPVLHKEPTVLRDPDITKDVKRWIVELDPPGTAPPVKLFVVTATIDPTDEELNPETMEPYSYPPLTTGFGRQINSNLLPHATAMDVKDLRYGRYRFWFKVGETKYENCIGVIREGP